MHACAARDVKGRSTDPMPLEALRDLLGLCRALYAASAASGAGPIELEDLGNAPLAFA
jgi:hypothetical protein